MAKTNFTKVEDAFESEKRKQQKEALLKEADLASGNLIEENPQIEQQKKIQAKRNLLVKALKRDLKIYGPEIFDKKFGITKKKLELLLKKEMDLTDSDYAILETVKQKIAHFKDSDLDFDDNLIQQERKKHINKRFNVNDKWLPLK